MHVQVKDTITAILNADNCDSVGDNCDCQLQSIDENDGASVTLNVTSDAAFDVLLGAVLEIPTGEGCVETPPNGHAAFRDLEVIDGNGDTIPRISAPPFPTRSAASRLRPPPTPLTFSGSPDPAVGAG
jgi:hypothetical protein